MQGPRAPWWIYGIAACVQGFLLLNLYAEVFGPGALGADLRYRDGKAVVVSVVPGFHCVVADCARARGCG